MAGRISSAGVVAPDVAAGLAVAEVCIGILLSIIAIISGITIDSETNSRPQRIDSNVTGKVVYSIAVGDGVLIYAIIGCGDNAVTRSGRRL